MPPVKTKSVARKATRRPQRQRDERRDRHAAARPDLDRAYVVKNNETTHVLLPVEEYERLIKADMARQAEARLDDPATEWHDFDEFKLHLAGSRVAATRKAKRLTQAALAEKLNVPQSQISRIERHPDQTTIRTLKRVAAALGVDVGALIE